MLFHFNSIRDYKKTTTFFSDKKPIIQGGKNNIAMVRPKKTALSFLGVSQIVTLNALNQLQRAS